MWFALSEDTLGSPIAKLLLTICRKMELRLGPGVRCRFIFLMKRKTWCFLPKVLLHLLVTRRWGSQYLLPSSFYLFWKSRMPHYQERAVPFPAVSLLRMTCLFFRVICPASQYSGTWWDKWKKPNNRCTSVIEKYYKDEIKFTAYFQNVMIRRQFGNIPIQ